MDARTVEMLAAALGYEPHSDLLRQVLAGLGPAHTAHLVAQTQAADNRTGSMNRYLLLRSSVAERYNSFTRAVSV
jgi:hypothetical protein